MSKQMLQKLASKLEALSSQVADTEVVIGFDAFVDESIRIVGKRTNPESFEAMPTIRDYGTWATEAAGRSGSREFVIDQVVAGGCTVNMGDGIATMGFPLHAFAGVGEPSHAVFEPFLKKCSSHTALGMEPGRAIVTEFDDGKLMLCAFSHFAKITPAYLREQFQDGVFRDACAKARGIAVTSWSVYPYMSECWRFLCEETLQGLTHRPRFFFDLADPASRTEEDIAEMMQTLKSFEGVGTATLSVNGNEANRIAQSIGLDRAEDSPPELKRLCQQLREHAEISEVSIHLVKGAITATEQGTALVAGPYCAKPKKSVGAGDRFNAGFFAGILLGLSPEERLSLGAASSGFFVRQARSATWLELVDFVRDWSEGAYDA